MHHSWPRNDLVVSILFGCHKNSNKVCSIKKKSSCLVVPRVTTSQQDKIFPLKKNNYERMDSSEDSDGSYSEESYNDSDFEEDESPKPSPKIKPQPSPKSSWIPPSRLSVKEETKVMGFEALGDVVASLDDYDVNNAQRSSPTKSPTKSFPAPAPVANTASSAIKGMGDLDDLLAHLDQYDLKDTKAPQEVIEAHNATENASALLSWAKKTGPTATAESKKTTAPVMAGTAMQAMKEGGGKKLSSANTNTNPNPNLNLTHTPAPTSSLTHNNSYSDDNANENSYESYNNESFSTETPVRDAIVITTTATEISKPESTSTSTAAAAAAKNKNGPTEEDILLSILMKDVNKAKQAKGDTVDDDSSTSSTNFVVGNVTALQAPVKQKFSVSEREHITKQIRISQESWDESDDGGSMHFVPSSTPIPMEFDDTFPNSVPVVYKQQKHQQHQQPQKQKQKQRKPNVPAPPPPPPKVQQKQHNNKNTTAPPPRIKSTPHSHYSNLLQNDELTSTFQQQYISLLSRVSQSSQEYLECTRLSQSEMQMENVLAECIREMLANKEIIDTIKKGCFKKISKTKKKK